MELEKRSNVDVMYKTKLKKCRIPLPGTSDGDSPWAEVLLDDGQEFSTRLLVRCWNKDLNSILSSSPIPSSLSSPFGNHEMSGLYISRSIAKSSLTLSLQITQFMSSAVIYFYVIDFWSFPIFFFITHLIYTMWFLSSNIPNPSPWFFLDLLELSHRSVFIQYIFIPLSSSVALIIITQFLIELFSHCKGWCGWIQLASSEKFWY